MNLCDTNRYLMRLKSYVCTRSRPEGSIVEWYLADECLTFCSSYFQGIETRFSRPCETTIICP